MANTKVKKFLSEVGRGEEALVEMMLVLVRALEERDKYTRGHSERVANLSKLIGKKLGLTLERQEVLYRGAILHDIGKIGIPDELLNKAGSFDPDERARMNQHPEKGHLLVLNCHLLWNLIPMIRNHHENYDGSGYPDGLRGDEIPIESRIVSLADYFDALATERPYKQALPKDQSIEYVMKMSGTKFDPKVVRAFLEVVHRYYEQTFKAT